MARCRCGIDQCGCHMAPGLYTTVRGDGSTGNPFMVDAQPAVAGSILFEDTLTVNFSTTGFGSPASPLSVTAQAQIGDLLTIESSDNDIGVTLTGLGTIDDPLVYLLDLPLIDTGGPGGTPGDVLIRGADGIFAPGPGASVPVGAIFVKPGLMGDGSIANPLGLDICTYADIKSPNACSRSAASPGQTYPAVPGITGETFGSANSLTAAGFVAAPPRVVWPIGSYFTVGGYRFYWNGTIWQPGVSA